MTRLALLLAFAAPAAARDLDRWLAWTRRDESGGRVWCIGDHGHSRGPYQIQQRPWRAFGGRLPWSVWAHDEPEARKVAARIIRACERKCVRAGRAVTYRNVRWFYRHGSY